MVRNTLLNLMAIIVLGLLLGACRGSNAEQQPTSVADETTTGAALFAETCARCHGDDARGMPFVGPDLTSSEFVDSHTDEELLAFIVEGRPANDPANTTGIPMPPRGGNPSLSDEQIMEIIDWLRAQ